MPIEEVPSPTEHGWTRCGDFIEPVWSEGPILPSRLEDNLTEVTHDGSSDEEDCDIIIIIIIVIYSAKTIMFTKMQYILQVNILRKTSINFIKNNTI